MSLQQDWQKLDTVYYFNQYPDLQNACQYMNDEEKHNFLINHFITHGQHEGRTYRFLEEKSSQYCLECDEKKCKKYKKNRKHCKKLVCEKDCEEKKYRKCHKYEYDSDLCEKSRCVKKCCKKMDKYVYKGIEKDFGRSCCPQNFELPQPQCKPVMMCPPLKCPPCPSQPVQKVKVNCAPLKLCYSPQVCYPKPQCPPKIEMVCKQVPCMPMCLPKSSYC